MDTTRRPLEDYFAAARAEEGPSEAEIRARVATAGSAAPWMRRVVAAALVVAGISSVLILLPWRSGDAPRKSTAVASGVPQARPAEAVKQRNQTDSVSPINEDHSMKPTTAALLASAALAVATTATPAHAQEGRHNQHIRTAEQDSITRRLERAAAERLGRYAADYWTMRLNGYKVRIDQMITSAELEKLNRLRVRFGMTVDEKARAARADVSVATHQDGGRSKQAKVEGGISFDMTDEDGMAFLSLFGETTPISGAHRSDFDALRGTVLDDLTAFLKEAAAQARAFAQEHHDEIARVADGENIDSALAKIDLEIPEIDKDARMGLMVAYGMVIEPLIMLYNGSDLRDFFGGGTPLSGAVTGLALPAQSVLRQNTPNPASGQTTVAYVLPEASPATSLRLYDASGALVLTKDIGSVPAGENSVTLDVSKLAAGVYLYQLSMQTSSGERVYSRTMQVR